MLDIACRHWALGTSRRFIVISHLDPRRRLCVGGEQQPAEEGVEREAAAVRRHAGPGLHQRGQEVAPRRRDGQQPVGELGGVVLILGHGSVFY